MDTVIQQVPGIVASSPMLEFHDRLSVGSGVTRDTMLLGVSPQYKEVRNLKILAGRFFDDEDAVQHAKVADLVLPLAEALFGSASASVGHTITVSGIPFVIIGVFKEGTETFDQSEISSQTILIPYPVARYFTGTDTLKQIFFTVRDSRDVEPTAARILALIQSRHHASSVYKAETLTLVLNVMGRIANALLVVLVFAAVLTIVVSHPRDRHPQGARSHLPRDQNAVPGRGSLAFALWRHHRHPHRPCHSLHRFAPDPGQDPHHRLVRGHRPAHLGPRRRRLRHRPSQQGRRARPRRNPQIRVTLFACEIDHPPSNFPGGYEGE
jgi:hypothetical protein